MEIMQYLSENHDLVLYGIAVISFMIEITVLGLSGPLLFFALACFATGILSSLGVLSSLEAEIVSIGVLMALFTFVLWKPLRQFQNSGGGPDNSSDMIGQLVPCITQVTSVSGSIRHSGINWNARLDPVSSSESIAEGDTCQISGVEGNVMLVKAKDHAG